MTSCLEEVKILTRCQWGGIPFEICQTREGCFSFWLCNEIMDESDGNSYPTLEAACQGAKQAIARELAILEVQQQLEGLQARFLAQAIEE